MKKKQKAGIPLPESLKIGPYRFRVLPKKEVKYGNSMLYGHIQYGPQTIEIETGLTPERTLSILMHEAIHGLDEVASIGLSEKQVTRLGTAMAGFMIDNDLLPDSMREAIVPHTKNDQPKE